MDARLITNDFMEKKRKREDMPDGKKMQEPFILKRLFHMVLTCGNMIPFWIA